MLDRIAGDIVLLWGAKRHALAFLAGALLVLALPPFDFFAVGFISFPVLLWLIEGAVPSPNARGALKLYPAAVTGWFFGFGYFLAGLWWLGNAVVAESMEFAWAIPLAVIGLPALLAFFFSGSAMLARAIWGRGIGAAAALAFGFGIGEWMRGFLFTGFPWNSLGLTIMPAAPFMQVLSVFGIVAMNALAVFVFALPGVLALSRFRLAGPVLSVLLLAGQAGYGVYRLNGEDAKAAPAGPVVRLVQPSIRQDEKWDDQVRDRIFATYLDMTKQAPEAGKPVPSMVIWPETAVPFLFTDRPDALAALGETLADAQTLLAGTVRQEGNRNEGETVRYYNSVLVVNGSGEITDAADKAHLVPFGEYLPMGGLLESFGLQQLVTTPGGFSPGSGRHRFKVAGFPEIAPLICYEIIFPGALGNNRPGLAVNVTNDAWYGRTPGPWQHLRLAQVRAAETGVPVARAANNGISAFIDGYGRIVSALPLDAVSVLDQSLPSATMPTLYSIHGTRIVFGVYLLLLAIAGLTNLFRRSSM
jgi:apolipoprotein N-acyltransferase